MSVSDACGSVKAREGIGDSNLGLALLDKRDLDGAIAEFREALRLKPDLPQAHNRLGIALRDKGDLDLAIAEFREALGLKPDYPEAHNDLGQALLERRKPGRSHR